MHLLGGDFHLGDPSIVRYRKQFPTLGYHDEFICDTVLAPLRKHDLLTMVGDCLVGAESYNLIKKFPCRKILILGNHEFEKQKTHFSQLVGVVDEIRAIWKWRSGFSIRHEPVHPLQLRGRVCVHAHTHENVIPDPRYICLSLEQTNFRLIQAEEILEGTFTTYQNQRV